eukprot:s351_g15.t1
MAKMAKEVPKPMTSHLEVGDRQKWNKDGATCGFYVSTEREKQQEVWKVGGISNSTDLGHFSGHGVMHGYEGGMGMHHNLPAQTFNRTASILEEAKAASSAKALEVCGDTSRLGVSAADVFAQFNAPINSYSEEPQSVALDDVEVSLALQALQKKDPTILSTPESASVCLQHPKNVWGVP